MSHQIQVRRFVVLPLLLAGLFLAVVASAQFSVNLAANLSVADRSNERVQPKIVPTADGGCYISWFDNADGGCRRKSVVASRSWRSDRGLVIAAMLRPPFQGVRRSAGVGSGSLASVAIGAQNGVHCGLVLRALGLELLQNVAVDSQRERVLAAGTGNPRCATASAQSATEVWGASAVKRVSSSRIPRSFSQSVPPASAPEIGDPSSFFMSFRLSG